MTLARNLPAVIGGARPELSMLRDTYACRCDESVMYDEALYPSRASGMWVWVEDDDEPYLDLVLGYSSNNFGHCHPEILAAAREACANLSQMHSFQTRVKLRLSQQLSEAVSSKWPYEVYFDVGGASVVGGALRLCRASTGNRLIVCFTGAFHGTSYDAATVTDDALLDKAQYGLGRLDADVIRLPFPDRYGPTATSDCLALLDDVLARGDVAGVIVEPIQGAAGFIIPPDDFLPRLRERTADVQVPLILDEIQTGVGRTGAMFAFQRYDIEPDIVLVSKSLAGGYYPLSALIAAPALFDGVPLRGTAFQSTFNNNPLGIAVALETLRIAAHHGLFENAAAQGSRLLRDLRFLSSCPPIVRLRGRGLAIAFDFIDADGAPSRDLARSFMHCALREHVILYACGVHGNVVKIAPMLGIDDGERALIADVLARTVARFAESMS